MTYDARHIANWFIQRAERDGKIFTVMSLLKLVYIAHGWNLALHDRPLIKNRIEAWRYGPVIPELYSALRHQGIRPTTIVPGYAPDLDADTARLVEQAYDIYGGMTSSQLSNLTHVSGGPWHIASRVGGHYAEIPDDLIKMHYVAKRQEAARKHDGE